MAFLSGVLVLGSIVWVLFSLTHPVPSRTITGAGTPGFVLTIDPGRSSVAFAVFLFIVSLLPALYIAGMLWLPARPLERAIAVAHRSARHPWPHWQSAYVALFVAALCCSALVAGYAVEGLRAQLRVTAQGLRYRAGGRSAAMSWADVRLMVLHWRPRSQTVELVGGADSIRVDLSAFAEPDRVLLVQLLPALGHLGPTAQHGPEEWVWRRGAQRPIVVPQ